MPSIQLLPDSLINKIAAGEVVERPASVVKELVENALDAKATQINIELLNGGKKSILVRDNGIGIHPEELKLAVSRHSTSKIKDVDDLFKIQTLGFRGEALASMASVSKMMITSKLQGSKLEAREISMEGGTIISESEVGHPEGTTVSVKYLFYQTPARLKFLKTSETELAHINDYVTKAALSRPEVSFRLSHTNKKILSTQPSQDLGQRIWDLFGEDLADSSYPISFGRDGIEIMGMVGHPQVSRSNNRNMYLFVNGRPVRDKICFHAIMEGYRDLLMRGKYPFVVLYLRVPNPMVDINVHPAKSEVRFSNSTVIHRSVYEAIRNTLMAQPWMSQNHILIHSKNTWFNEENKTTPLKNYGDASWPQKVISNVYLESSQKKIEFGKTPYAELHVLGQLLGTYIVCQTREKLVLIDQHAAYERIGFEKLILQHKEGNVATQQLLLPENFDLNPSDTEILKKYLEELETFGIEIDFFGGNTFVLRSIPVLLEGKIKIKDLVLDLIGDSLEKGKITSIKEQMHKIFARLACHAAIRAHDKLSLDEMRALLCELDRFQFTSFCPHGRPVMVEISGYEIEKWFKRI